MWKYTKESPPSKALLEGAIVRMHARAEKEHPSEQTEFSIAIFALEQALEKRKHELKALRSQ